MFSQITKFGIRHKWQIKTVRLGFLVVFLLAITVSTVGAMIFVSHKISGTIPDFDDVGYRYFQISPDGQTVVYRAFSNSHSWYELISVPVDGSRQPVRLSGQLPNGYRDKFFAISQDSSRVVVTDIEQGTNEKRLMSVPINGGTAVRLNTGD